jgi:hypothetical protein
MSLVEIHVEKGSAQVGVVDREIAAAQVLNVQTVVRGALKVAVVHKAVLVVVHTVAVIAVRKVADVVETIDVEVVVRNARFLNRR